MVGMEKSTFLRMFITTISFGTFSWQCRTQTYISVRTFTRLVRRYASGLSVRFIIIGKFIDDKKYRHVKCVHQRKCTVILMGSVDIISSFVRTNRYVQRFLSSRFATLFKAFSTKIFSIFTCIKYLIRSLGTTWDSNVSQPIMQ